MRFDTLKDFINHEGREKREHLARQIFDNLDYDGDGTIQVFEIKRALARLRGQDEFTETDGSLGVIKSRSGFNRTPAPEVTAELVSQYVDDALHTLRQEEELAVVGYPWQRLALKMFSVGVSKQIDFPTFKKLLLLVERRAWHLYKDIDANNDGILTAAEIKRAALGEGLHLKTEDAQAFIDALDRNGDGTVDFTELRRFLFTVPAVLKEEAHLTELFGAYRLVYSANIEFNHVPWAEGKDAFKQEQMRYFAAGAIAGAISRTLTAPLDRIRIYFQIQTAKDFASARKEGLVSAAKHVVRSFRTALVTILKDGGVASFYRGNLLNCMRIIPESAIGFVAMEHLTDMMKRRDERLDEYLEREQDGSLTEEKDAVTIYLSPASRRFVSGALSGTLGQFAAYPIESVRMRVMSMNKLGAGFDSSLKITKSTMGLVDAHIDIPTSALFKRVREGSEVFRGNAGSWLSKSNLTFSYSTAAIPPAPPAPKSLILEAVRDIYSKAGWRGFYKGILPASLSMAPFMGTNMAVFEVLKRRHKRRTGKGHVGFGFVLTFGCISGSIAATLVYPLQLIRVRMQVQGTASHPATYKGIRDCFVQTYKGEGWRAFYRGLGTSLSKVAPATGLAFLSYEWSKALLGVG